MVAKKLFFVFLLNILMVNIIKAATFYGERAKQIKGPVPGQVFHTTELIWVKSMDSKESSNSDFDKNPGIQLVPSENSEGTIKNAQNPAGSVFLTTENNLVKKTDLRNDEPYYDEIPKSQSAEQSAISRISASIVKLMEKLANGAKSAIDYYTKKT